MRLSNKLPDNMDLSGKTYFITGAANGIGRAVSASLSTLNANVIMLDKNDRELNAVYDKISSQNKGEHIIVHQDLTVLTQNHCDALLNQIQLNFNKLDGLIHCAVETGHLAPIEHYCEADWSNVIRANLHSPYLLTRTLMPLLSTDEKSVIIFSTSEQALKASAYWGAFAVAQQGLNALTRTWAQETENSKTTFILIDPGKVNTAFLSRLYPGLNPNQHPDSETIANAYIYLLTDSSFDLHGKFFQIQNLELKSIK